MECLLALFTIKAAVSNDRSLYLDRAVKRTTKQATEIDAHWWLVGHRSLVAARWANWKAVMERPISISAIHAKSL
jgi:hypothetical protein